MSDHPTIGASQISALLGIHPWMTQHDVWKQLVHGIKQEDNESMAEGREWEPDIINIYARRTNQAVMQNTETRARDWLHATPDGLIWPKGFFSKIADTTKGMDAKKTNDKPWPVLPQYYVLQGQTQMYCWPSLESVDFAALFPHHHFGIYPVTPDLDLQSQLNDVAEKFVKDFVLPKKLPPVDATESCRQAIIAQWPKEESGEFLEPSSEVLEVLAKIRDLEPALADLTSAMDENKNILRAFIGDKAGIQFEEGYASFKRNKSSSKTDWEQVARQFATWIRVGQWDNPDVEKAFKGFIKDNTREIPGPRVLRIQWKKGGDVDDQA